MKNLNLSLEIQGYFENRAGQSGYRRRHAPDLH